MPPYVPLTRGAPMKLSRYAAVFVGFVLLAASASPQTFDVPSPSGTVPSGSVRYWIKYRYLGPQTQPFPIVWISPQHFKIYDFFESLLVLPRQKYSVVSRFTATRIAQDDCLNPVPSPTPSGTMEISLHADGRTQACVLPHKIACRYFSDVLQLPGADWKPSEREPIETVMRNLECKG